MRIKPFIVRTLLLAALAGAGCLLPAHAEPTEDGDLPPEPVALDQAEDEPAVAVATFDGEIILDSVIGEAVPLPLPFPSEPIPTPRSVLPDATDPPPARIVDVTATPLDGMLLDGGFDEMPFEASSGRWFWNGGWYVGGESLWMDRSRNNRQQVVLDAGAPNVGYSTFAQPFNVAPGARATIGKSLGRDYLDRDRFVEFVYYGGMTYSDLDGWNGIDGGNTLFTPLFFGAPGFNAAGTYATTFNSDFNSYEWNYKLRRRLGRDKLVMSPDGSWTRHAERGWLPALIVGTRLANVNEDFSLTSTRPDVPTSEFGGRYTINAANWLLGLNLGGELISQNEFYYWGIRGRAAPALSFASTSQSAIGINTTEIGPEGFLSFSDRATRTAPGFIGDLTLLAGWQISPNFSLQVGYDFLWVAGMATATRQFNLDNRDNNAIDAGGQTFYNGVSFGFYGSW
jgi:hypothetical protein